MERPLDPSGALGAVGRPGDGAVLLFLGRVRDSSHGRRVVGLEYEAYGEMAASELRRIAEEAAERFEVGEIYAGHRLGSLQPGEVSVMVAVASPHRDVGYAASRYVIEEIKKRLPVWKREKYSDGSRRWLGTLESAAESSS